MGTHLQASCKKDNFEKVFMELGWENVPNWECLFVHRKTRIILFGTCG